MAKTQLRRDEDISLFQTGLLLIAHAHKFQMGSSKLSLKQALSKELTKQTPKKSAL